MKINKDKLIIKNVEKQLKMKYNIQDYLKKGKKYKNESPFYKPGL